MITGIIITLNEEKQIRECIESLKKVCNEIIVVDSLSTDCTRDIASSMGAIVIKQKYLGDGFQKNIALPRASNDWILTLDADERLDETAVQSIKSIDLENSQSDAFALKRRNYIGSRWIAHCGWYPDYCVRLYNKQQTKFSEVKQHASVKSNNSSRLEGNIIHYSFENIGQLFSKPGRDFSGRAAKILYQEEKKASAFSPFIHGFSAFFKMYLLKRGFLGGVDGFTVSLSSGVNSYLKYAKLLEFQRDPKVLEKEDFNNVW